ncbi:Helicase conserved C-terminal domain-containing protein [Seinonella peptonophila]|uniref:Helicase conserved C-terminal domain-containing protein n=1 Tax=Seinonella peptonophila TaxID=112248 RepID=A0A1M4TPJ1_9BACL|nr:SNF2-related protein [Seinonella peptonophila]SHE46381.1 Helicase conserved C-terminal domain-containing protein [Seinonella peptonophila]
MNQISIRFDRTWLTSFKHTIETGEHWSNWERFQLAFEAAEQQIIPQFDTLQCLKHLQTFQPLPHQIEVTRQVISEMHGRAILADEVGLGKTIEAGLILKEYLIRGLVHKVLILVPASLVLQWTRELNQKFQIPAMAQKKAWMWDSYDILVASMDTAKREPHRSEILKHQYDLLIVDEAHKLKNKRTKNWQFINQLDKKYCLLLTATPVQNEMEELYNLVTLLKPGQLGKQREFQNEFVAAKRKAKNEAQLRQEIQRVLIRNRRQDHDLPLTKRMVHTIPIELSPAERELYDGVTQFVQNQCRQGGTDPRSMLSLLVLQKEVCSSRDAVFHTLFKLFQKDGNPLSPEVASLIEKLRAVQYSSKVNQAVQLIKEIPEKLILFTEYRATQEMIIRQLEQEGIYAIPYRGGFSRNKKDWMMELFAKRAQVMVATEAGGEGINLQFCHHMINFDMPWNPMRVEQRIGRIHRLGQENDVFIYNFATIGTIEEHIIWLLHEKINLFESVIGELETILEKMDGDDSLEKRLLHLIACKKDDLAIREELNHWGERFRLLKEEVLADEQQSSNRSCAQLH